jgi:hemerythrin-like domain-containing protein
MKATEQLKEEHKAIKLMLSVLSNVSKKLESGEKVDEELHELLHHLKDKYLES